MIAEAELESNGVQIVKNFRDVPEDMRSLLGQISISHFDRHLGFKHIVGFFQFCKGKGLIG